jgi:PAS domain S-box-containing protein
MTNLLNMDTELAASVVRETPEAIVVSGPDGKIQLWNKGAERIFGYTAAEAVGSSLDLIVPEKLRGRHWEGYDAVMASGTSRYGDTLLKVPATRKDGQRMSIEFSVALLKDADGKVTGIAAVIRDATDRWNEDRALRKELADLRARAAATPTDSGKPSFDTTPGG